MNRFIDKNGEVFVLINESKFDYYVLRNFLYFKDVDSAGIEDYTRELCKRIFGRFPNERPEELQKSIKISNTKLIQKLLREEES